MNRERGSGGGFEFGSDSQARTPWLHSLMVLVYLAAIAAVAWPLAVWGLNSLGEPVSLWFGVAWVSATLLSHVWATPRISPWWAVPGALAVVITRLWWPVPWWVALLGMLATALGGFGVMGLRFVLEQREFPWAVLEARSPHPPAPEPEPRIITVHHGVRSPGSDRDLAETRAALASAGVLRLPEPAPASDRAQEERMNWMDLEQFVRAIDRGEPADMRHWVTDPPRIMRSGRPMTEGMWRRFTKAVESVGGAVRAYRTAPLELCMRPPEILYLLRERSKQG